MEAFVKVLCIALLAGVASFFLCRAISFDLCAVAVLAT
jgi:hypothetical protein